jgi:hypothetical protein
MDGECIEELIGKDDSLEAVGQIFAWWNELPGLRTSWSMFHHLPPAGAKLHDSEIGRLTHVAIQHLDARGYQNSENRL